VQPILSDGFGHYSFYALPGLYTVVIMFGGKVQQFYIDQTLGNAGSSPASPLVLSTNGTPNFSQTSLNFIQGSGITLSTDNLGNMTITGSSITYPGDPTKFLNGTGVFSVPPAPTGLSLQTNEVPNVLQTLLDLHASTGISLVDNGAGRVTVTNTAPYVVPPAQFGFANWKASVVDGQSTNATAIGWTQTFAAIGATGTQTAATATEPPSNNWKTAATAQVNNYFIAQQEVTMTLGVMRRMGYRIRANQNATLGHVRYWVGAVDTSTGVNPMYSDQPAKNFVGFRFSPTSAGDTSWVCVSQTGSGGGLQTLHATGVIPTTTVSQYLEIQPDGSGGLNYYIDNVLVGNITTNIPSNTLPLLGIVDVDNQNNAAERSFEFISWYLENVK
jgi:hypothetical protein